MTGAGRVYVPAIEPSSIHSGCVSSSTFAVEPSSSSAPFRMSTKPRSSPSLPLKGSTVPLPLTQRADDAAATRSIGRVGPAETTSVTWLPASAVAPAAGSERSTVSAATTLSATRRTFTVKPSIVSADVPSATGSPPRSGTSCAAATGPGSLVGSPGVPVPSPVAAGPGPADVGGGCCRPP